MSKAKDGLTVGIVQMLAKQHSNAVLRTILSTMHSVVTHETAIGGEEQICVGTS
jgi:hypothetical protein